ncbi:hypothetical protein LIER_36106 [Lithospermum erythrorhizon]|uniref:WAT1-related protein n=1 Tax=Lithospermum erythrorhizon TaxID=34254 RepID=A0AAV3P3K0_LITER
MMEISRITESLPYIGMILSQCAQVGLIILSKQAMASGMTNFTFVFYSNALATLILLPSFFFYRSRPPLNFQLICRFFLLGILGCSAQLTGYAGIKYTNASFASTMLNLIPGFTFILAIIFRLEKVDWRSASTLAKSIGTVVSIVGAFIVTLYKGPELLNVLSSVKSLHPFLSLPQSDWVIGGLFLAVDCVAASAFLIVQASILKSYPAELIIVCFYCLFAAILSAVVSIFIGGGLGAWSLLPTTRWLTVLYSGVLGSAFQVGVSTWCVQKKGPVFVAMFHPLGIVIAAILGISFLGDILYLGRYVLHFHFDPWTLKRNF